MFRLTVRLIDRLMIRHVHDRRAVHRAVRAEKRVHCAASECRRMKPRCRLVELENPFTADHTATDRIVDLDRITGRSDLNALAGPGVRRVRNEVLDLRFRSSCWLARCGGLVSCCWLVGRCCLVSRRHLVGRRCLVGCCLVRRWFVLEPQSIVTVELFAPDG